MHIYSATRLELRYLTREGVREYSLEIVRDTAIGATPSNHTVLSDSHISGIQQKSVGDLTFAMPSIMPSVY